MLEPGLVLREVALEPAHSGALVLRRTTLSVEVDELERVLERKVRQLTGGILSSPECSALDRTAEANMRVRRSRHRTYVLMAVRLATETLKEAMAS
jgi:hypothetical protein